MWYSLHSGSLSQPEPFQENGALLWPLFLRPSEGRVYSRCPASNRLPVGLDWGPGTDPTTSSQGPAMGLPELTLQIPSLTLAVTRFQNNKGYIPCLAEAVSTPGNVRREMSTAGTRNSTEPLSGTGPGRPDSNQAQNLKDGVSGRMEPPHRS